MGRSKKATMPPTYLAEHSHALFSSKIPLSAMKSSRNDQKSRWQMLGSPAPGMGRRTRQPLGIKVNKMKDGLDAVNGYFPESDQESENDSQSEGSASLTFPVAADYNTRVNEEEIIEERVEDSGQEDDIIDSYFDKEVFQIETKQQKQSDIAVDTAGELHSDFASQCSYEIDSPHNNQSSHYQLNRDQGDHDHDDVDQYNQDNSNIDEHSQDQNRPYNQDHVLVHNYHDHYDQVNHHHQKSFKDAMISTEPSHSYTNERRATVGTNTSNVRYSRRSKQNYNQHAVSNRGRDFTRKKIPGRKRTQMHVEEYDYDDENAQVGRYGSKKHGRNRKRGEMDVQDHYYDDESRRIKMNETKRRGRYMREPEPAVYSDSYSEDERETPETRRIPRSVNHRAGRYSRPEISDLKRRKLLEFKSERKASTRTKKAKKHVGMPRKQTRKSVQFVVSTPSSDVIENELDVQPIAQPEEDDDIESPERTTRRRSWLQQRPEASVKRHQERHQEKQPRRSSLSKSTPVNNEDKENRRKSLRKSVQFAATMSNILETYPLLDELSYTPVANDMQATPKETGRVLRRNTLKQNSEASNEKLKTPTTPTIPQTNDETHGKTKKKRKSSKLNYGTKRKSSSVKVKSDQQDEVNNRELLNDADADVIGNTDMIIDNDSHRDNHNTNRKSRRRVSEIDTRIADASSRPSPTPNVDLGTPRSILRTKKTARTPRSLDTQGRRLSVPDTPMVEESAVPLPLSRWSGVSPYITRKFVPESPNIAAPNTPSAQGTPRSTGVVRAAIRRSIKETPLGQLPAHSGLSQSTPMAAASLQRSPLPCHQLMVTDNTEQVPVWGDTTGGHNTLPGRSDSDSSLSGQAKSIEQAEDDQSKKLIQKGRKRRGNCLNPRKNNAAKRRKTAARNRVCGLEISKTKVQEILNKADNDEDGPRRGNRTRIPPVRYWKTKEYVEYERRESGLAVKRIVRAQQTPDNRPKKVTKPKKSVRNHRMMTSSDSESENIFEDVNPLHTVRGDNDEPVEMRIFNTPAMLNLVAPNPLPDGSEVKSILLHKYFSQRLFSAGVFVLLPKAEKGLQLVENDTIVFYIVKGLVDVTVEDSTVRLGKDCTFFVPSGNVYNIKNALDAQAKLHFIQIKG